MQIMEVLPVRPFEHFSSNLVNFSQPTELGYFSLDGNRCYQSNDEQLRFYNPPDETNKICFDLRLGYNKSVLKDENKIEGLSNLLTWISTNDKICRSTNFRLNWDFVVCRGTLTRLLCSPYNDRDWIIATTLFNGTIYIKELDTEQQIACRNSKTPLEHERDSYWGFSFEDYVTKPRKESRKDKTDNFVNTNQAFFSILQRNIDEKRILLSAEIDCCVQDDDQKPPLNYVEIKTARQLENYNQQTRFYKKLIHIWGQSYLAGVPKIVFGMRDDFGVVKSLRKYDTQGIPKICERHSLWKESVALNFLNKFLDFLKKSVTIDDPNAIYILEFKKPYEYVSIKLLGTNTENVLPNWYVDAAKDDYVQSVS